MLGGSFNPAHEGHRHIALTALRSLGLDQVWWLVSPQNPLKAASDMAPFADRIAGARKAARHPHLQASDIEPRLGTRFTSDTLAQLQRRYPRVRFVWLMGADNLGQMHRWRKWRSIFNSVPIAVFDRPPNGLKMRASPAGQSYRRARLAPSEARSLAGRAAPAWIFFPSRLEPSSSTEIRREGRGIAGAKVAVSRHPPYVQG